MATITGTALADLLNGTASDDQIDGLAGNDTLNGAAGNDTLNGGTGNDTYIVEVATDVVTEAAGAGIDTVKSAVTWTLGLNVERLTLTGAGAINGVGNTLNNVLTGNTANNILNGGLGNDTLIGGLGNDTYVVDSAFDVVTEGLNAGTDTVQSLVTYTLGLNVENLTLLIGPAAINGTGNALNNFIVGNTADNVLAGGDGNDTLVGDLGNDTLIGGIGNDIYGVSIATDVVTEEFNAGTDTVQSSITYTLGSNVENLTLIGAATINGTGNTLANALTGNTANNALNGGDGNDTLNGGIGNDTMVGGLGNDTYVRNVAGDVVTEGVNAGTDTVQSAVTYTLGPNVENLTLTGAVAINGTGNTLANVLTGNTAANILNGGSGNDTLNGGFGNDTLLGGAGKDLLVWDAADVSVNGGTNTDTLRVEGANVTLDLTVVPDAKLLDVEIINLTGTGNNTLNLSASDVLALSSTTDTLRVDGNAGDSVSAGAGWLYTGDIASSGQTYAQYTQGAAVLQIDTDATRNVGFSINLSSLSGANGFQISGESTADRSGFAVSGAGDVNGDGFDDFLVGAYGANVNGNDSGTTYVIFGKAGGFAATLELSALSGAQGFRILGEAGTDQSGRAVSTAGDVNGDGFADLIVGAPSANQGASYDTGASYVVFGRSAGFASDLDLSTLSGADGFQISGAAANDQSAISVSDAGDVNGDGFDDLLVGAWGYGAPNNGAAYMVFGKNGGFTDINLSALGAADGFRITGGANYDNAGWSVSSAGDVNGDGFDDLLVGARGYGANNGAAYVVFGKSGGFTDISLSALGAADGFRITGGANNDYAGASVSSAGDVNGDGFDDLLVGADRYGAYDNGAAYVVFGKSGGFTDINLSALGAADGFRITGGANYDYAGVSVSSAGDVNGDGFDDVLVGAYRYGASDKGAAYVVFGKGGGFTNINLSALGAADGFRITGETASDGAGFSVSAVGDVNGDGFSDLMIGADRANPHGNDSGASYVIFGRDYRGDVEFSGTAGNDVRTGTTAHEAFVGGRGNDTLNGSGGADVFRGGAGNDVIRVADLTFADVDGGGGLDTLGLTGTELVLDLTLIADNRISGIEVIDLTGNGDNAATLSVRDVLDLSGTTNTLRVDGNAGDELISTGQNWLIGETVDIGGVTYQSYTRGAATLLVDSDLLQSVS